MSSEASNYRARIYGRYVAGRQRPLAPVNIGGLKPRMPYLRLLVRRHFPSDTESSVLDIGCGHGALIHALSEAGYRNVRGIDGSPEQVAAAHRLGIPTVEHGDVMSSLASQPSESLDVVVAFDVIEHFTKSELVVLTDEVRRVLRPHGRWIIHTPNAESPFGARMRYWDMTHELAFTRTSLGQLLLVSGFHRVDCFEDRPAVHGAKSAVRYVLWRVIRAGLVLYTAVETGALDMDAVFSQNLLAVAWRE